MRQWKRSAMQLCWKHGSPPQHLICTHSARSQIGYQYQMLNTCAPSTTYAGAKSDAAMEAERYAAVLEARLTVMASDMHASEIGHQHHTLNACAPSPISCAGAKSDAAMEAERYAALLEARLTAAAEDREADAMLNRVAIARAVKVASVSNLVCNIVDCQLSLGSKPCFYDLWRPR